MYCFFHPSDAPLLEGPVLSPVNYPPSVLQSLSPSRHALSAPLDGWMGRGMRMFHTEGLAAVEDYSVVQLNLTPEIEVFYMLHDGYLSNFSMTSLKQYMEMHQIENF